MKIFAEAPVARVILFGVGALGQLVMKALKGGYPLIEVVGAVDNDPGKIGRPLGSLVEGFPQGNVIIAPDLAACLAGLDAPADVVYHMTESELAHIEAQMIPMLERGLNVISASEAMFHPELRFSDVAGRLDAAARRHDVSITGCGINPGFVFDALPMMLARATSDITAVRISRTIDVTGTGPGDIDHVGYGLWPGEFQEKIASGRIVGHMGMPESIATLAERFNMPIDRIEERWETTTAAFPVDSGDPVLGTLEPGRVIGITQEGMAFAGAQQVMTIRLAMFYEPARHGLVEEDRIEIDGAHAIRAALTPAAVSLFGAANVVVNATHDVMAAPPGLVNVLDFSIGGVRRGGFRIATDPARLPAPGLIHVVRVPAGES